MEGNGGLESAVEEANEQETCASGLGEELGNEVSGYSSEDNQQVRKFGSEESGLDKKEGTNRAAAAIIYNKETGEFYFELKPSSYPIKEARGKLAFVGGKVEHTDRSSLDALIREIREEVVNEKAQEILIGKLTQLGSYYHTIVEFVDGLRYETDVYKINVDSDKEWNIVKDSSLAEGQKQILNFQQIRGRFGDFAFKYDEPLKKLFEEEYSRNFMHVKEYAFRLPIINNAAYRTQTNILGSHTSRFDNEGMYVRLAA